MNEKKPYGATTAEFFELGDIVEWSIWNNNKESFVPHYGVITEIKNKLISNRLVSICTAVPLDNSLKEIELFSLSLTLVSKAGEERNEIDS
jgi:hypothetical protein